MAPLGVSGFFLGEAFVDVQLLVVLSLLPVADDSPRNGQVFLWLINGKDDFYT